MSPREAKTAARQQLADQSRRSLEQAEEARRAAEQARYLADCARAAR